MPRAAGQIDRAKSEAILDAAGRILVEQGFSAPMARIAREAGVSKQTIYNHYGAKTDLVRALVSRRTRDVVAALDAPGAEEHPEETLTAYARVLINLMVAPPGYAIMRLVIQSAAEMPELARDVYDAGPRHARARLAAFLGAEHRAGRLDCPDPDEAAAQFAGMAIGHMQLAALIGIPPKVDQATVERMALNVARRFMRAYAR